MGAAASWAKRAAGAYPLETHLRHSRLTTPLPRPIGSPHGSTTLAPDARCPALYWDMHPCRRPGLSSHSIHYPQDECPMQCGMQNADGHTCRRAAHLPPSLEPPPSPEAGGARRRRDSLLLLRLVYGVAAAAAAARKRPVTCTAADRPYPSHAAAMLRC